MLQEPKKQNSEFALILEQWIEREAKTQSITSGDQQQYIESGAESSMEMTMPIMTESSIRVSDSTRKKLSAKTHSVAKRTSDRNKSAIDAALGKFTDDFDDDIAKRSSLGRKDPSDLGISEHTSASSKGKRTSSGSRRAARTADPLNCTRTTDQFNCTRTTDQLNCSEHSTRGRAAGNADDIGLSEHSASTSGHARSNRVTKKFAASADEDSDGFENLKDDESVRNSRTNSRGVRTGRKKTDRERHASPGPIKKRSSSLVSIKKRTASPGPIKNQSTSPGPIKHAPVNPTPPSPGPVKKRSSSLGHFKHTPRKFENTPSKKRTESPGPLKKRAQSPGPNKKRTNSVGALSRRGAQMGPERVSKPGDSHGELANMLGQVSGTQPRKKGTRSVASAPAQDLKRSDLRSSNKLQKHKSSRMSNSRGPPSKSQSYDSAAITSVVERMSTRYDLKGYQQEESQGKNTGSDNTQTTYPAELSEGNDGELRRASPKKVSPRSKPRRSVSAFTGTSIRQPQSPKKTDQTSEGENDIAKHKVRRSNSVAPTPSEAPRSPENKGGLTRAHSMLLHREMTRRGKSNSLMDLVQYKEEEIHSTSYFASNHVLVNRERMKRGLRPLTRNIAMDEQARKCAQAIAESNGFKPLKSTYVGNVLRGESIRSIHRSTMQQKQGRERSNLLNPYFQEFGVGTCKGSDGMLYMCQLFSERLELALTDTTSQ